MVAETEGGSGQRADRAFWAVIPAGGSGTRLWPLSRAARPKFLLPLLGQRSLLQQTAHRLGLLTPPERTFVVCGPAHAAPVARQLPTLPESNLIVEPSPKGTGPALALAAAIIARLDPDAVIGSFAADHEVAYEDAFVAAVRVAIVAAEDGSLVTIGLPPTRPETGYGYIERTDEPVAGCPEGTAYRAAGFVEKPDQERAEAYVASGRYLWNASMFVWTARALLDELERLQPALRTGVEEIAAAWGGPDQDQIAAEVWANLAETTIDQGVMERAHRIAVVPADLGWSDVGDWHGLGELIQRDLDGNAVRGDLIQSDTRNSVVWSETGRLIALVGLENIAVVDTEDALLVIERGSAQEVRRIVEQLKQLHRTSYQ
ncbi:MAG: Mannose-1-phosphate guanylyltransferase [uncultured Thermomicrobiales bacterium]|uniref:mannose-1-phosphate guanylyltransferase n=1 Tax=uncultured Thermomicrobiales bacterium TaxID=1645740 RepID=A0A6J4V205_9BACT|nr:MAG: Mannose-1-phosphate guanylyltransferase [uncultured Thermomicrobiales bacterium]